MRTFERLLFGFCFFHAIVQDRRKFGSLGWNISYAFTQEDLAVCRRQLLDLVQVESEIPYEVLQFLGASINYGGRVTDPNDKRLISALISKYVGPQLVHSEDYVFSQSGLYYCPASTELSEVLAYIEGLPLSSSAEAFGLHANCEIATAHRSVHTLLHNMLEMEAPDEASAQVSSKEQVVHQLAQDLLDQLPPLFELAALETQFPTDYRESMNTVLKQECVRFNVLLHLMTTSLRELGKALRGTVVLSSELDRVMNQLFLNTVPDLFANKSFLSLKPLSGWTTELIQRIAFFADWIHAGARPPRFWMGAFFFPQAFMAGILQNYARSQGIPIDKLSFAFQVEGQPPLDGVEVYGLFLEAATMREGVLAEAQPKELYSGFPSLFLIPVVTATYVKPLHVYECPCYKILSRSGTLSTTGHSTNFVLYVDIPTYLGVPPGNPKDHAQQLKDQHMISSVALFLALSF